MVIVTLADIHGYASGIDRISGRLAAADLVILAGDITRFGGMTAAKRVIDRIRQHTSRIAAVAGNCDLPEVETYLDEQDLSLHGNVRRINGIRFAGIGGSLPCPGPTPNEMTESEFRRHLVRLTAGLSNTEPCILITHQPPFNTLNDTTANGTHAGSRSIRQFIEQVQPMICITGHIHEGAGIDTIGNTQVINPGPFFDGHYGHIIIGRGIESIKICSYYETTRDDIEDGK